MSDAESQDSLAIDWHGARARLDSLGASIDGARRNNAALLRQRGARLAAPPTEPAATDLEAMLAYRRGTGHIAVPVERLREALKPRSLLTLPGTPPHILGVVLSRGQVVPVIELGWFIDPAAIITERPSLLLVVEAATGRFALAADHIEGVRQLSVNEGADALRATGRAPPFVVGLADDMLTIIDLELLAADARFLVQEEVAG